MSANVVVLDNYDSFTYNLVQILEEMGASLRVFRNDEIDIPGIKRLSASHLVISPGPGRPETSGVTCEAVSAMAGEVPILGVCLGHQAIGQVFGAEIARGPVPVHGKTSMMTHDSKTIYRGVSNPFEATRYHSLVVKRETIPSCLEVSCTSEDGQVMGIRHRSLPLEGVQFHPESILTGEGRVILENFLRMRA